jgi:GWxTD domain-containing protein
LLKRRESIIGGVWTGLLILLVAVSGFSITQESKAAKDPGLPLHYKKWLDEEVVYIITSMERDVFLKLQSDRERDLFLEAFWKQRDPTPGSPENEFKTEHYRRFNYANHFYGRETTRPGWRTDRGRFHIILGPPNDIQRFEGKSMVYPCEVWFYQGKTDLGLPAGFNIVFFKDHGQGEYRLYRPASDGPMALLTRYEGNPLDYLTAYQELKEVEPELAEVSLALVPGEDSGVLGQPSLSSELLLQKIELTPRNQVEEKYAQKFLQYKDVVEVEYTANYIDSNTLVKVFNHASGLPFIHLAIEPRKLSVNQYQNKFYTTLKLNGSLSLADGRIIYQYDRTIDLTLEEDQMARVKDLPFSIQDVIPVVPGEYRLSVLVKNEASKEFTSLEQIVRIPEEASTPQMTPLLLGYERARLDAAQKKRQMAFQLGESMVSCQPDRVFHPDEVVVVAFQVLGMKEEAMRKADVQFVFFRDGQVFKKSTRKMAEEVDPPNVAEEFRLADFPPYHYEIQAALLVGGVEVAGAREEFDVTHSKTVIRPWVRTRVLPESDHPMFSQIIGTQLFNLGRMDEAQTHLERAYRLKPDSLETAIALGRVYMERGEPDRVEALVGPFLDRENPAAYEVYVLAGRALQKTGQFMKALEVLDQAILHYGINANLLNALGECYHRLGKDEDALAAWKKSLELNADQPDIKRNIDAIKR